jgi:hypothetical protein
MEAAQTTTTFEKLKKKKDKSYKANEGGLKCSVHTTV